MRVIYEDIQRFMMHSDYTEQVKRKYTRYLKGFADYLGSRLHKPPEVIDLERIYEYKDLSTMSFFGPIDARIVDDFFSSICTLNCFHIKETRYALGSFFRYLERNYKFHNPIPLLTFNLNTLVPNTRPNRSLTKHEILRLLQTIVTRSPELERDLMLFTLLLSSGCRISEIVALRILDFEIPSCIFKIVKAKNKTQRIGYLVDGMGEVIKRYCKKHKLTATDYLFQIDTNRRLSIGAARTLLQKYCQIAKIPDFTLHGTRHTFITMMKEAGCDITTIQQMIGHEPNRFDTTEMYIDQNVIKNKDIHIKQNEELISFLKSRMRKDTI